MKKVFVVLFLLNITTCLYAQCFEVKGVETKIVCTEACEISLAKYGFSFSNKNKFQVTVEAELWEIQREMIRKKVIIPSKIIKTHTFVIDAGEVFIWKTGLYYSDWRTNETDGHYIKFKTFRCSTTM